MPSFRMVLVIAVAEWDLAVGEGRSEVGICSLVGGDGANVKGLGVLVGTLVERVCGEVDTPATADAIAKKATTSQELWRSPVRVDATGCATIPAMG